MTVSNPETQYLAVMREILHNGVDQFDRTGTGTREIWAPTIRADLAAGFPCLTTKEVRWQKAVAELLWMVRGGRKVSELHRLGVHYWDAWADKSGDLGPVYGAQWRGWKTPGGAVDQLQQAVDSVRDAAHRGTPSRRIVVSAWNVGDLQEMRLPPCHLLFQFGVQAPYLHCAVYQRSADWFLGVPFNLVMYGALTHMVAKITGLEPGILQMQFGSAHLYSNHLDQAREQLGRQQHRLPALRISDLVTSLDSAEPGDFLLVGYTHEPHIAAPISV